MTHETRMMRARQHADRWSSHGESTGIRHMSELLHPHELRGFEIFREFKDAFLEDVSQDVSLVEWKAGATLFEEGSYLDLAFWIVEGEVELFLKRHEESARPIFSTGVMRATVADRHGDAPAVPGPSRPAAGADGPITFLSSLDLDLREGEHLRLGRGEVFGEIGALNGWPQSVTARTATDCTLLQIRVPALRKIKRRSKVLKRRIDEAYRARTLRQHLATTPLLRGLDDGVLDALVRRVELVSCDPGDVVVREGEAADALFLVRSGFLRLSQKVGDGELVVTYLSKGETQGGPELLVDGVESWQSTATSVGFSELVRISRDDFAGVLARHPGVERRLWEAAVDLIRDTGFARRNVHRSDLVEFALGKGLVQGNSVLVIDLEKCTRCDDCVRACAATHDGRPRFVREGEKYRNFLVARSCYHCEDPVCLVGCPTGAIHRANVGDVVAVDDHICIGCSACAQNCPYDAIVMHDTGETWDETALPKHLRGEERRVASKCDLCYASAEGPACVSSCPQACAFRITSLEEFDALLEGRAAPPGGPA